MAIQRIKPIDDLYTEVADFDLVVVPDVALASALNRRLERPHFGPFAITPRRLAARRREYPEERRAFLEVVQRTDLDWKAASVAIEEVLQCWDHQGDPAPILSYDGFDTPAIRRVIRIHDELDITSRELDRTRIDGDKSVAVVEANLLTPLQRSILPSEYTPIELFHEEPFELPEVRIFASPAAVVDAVMDRISPSTAEDVAVVLEDDSEYAVLLESALETAGIPYRGGPGFTDDGELRALMACLRTAFAGEDTRIGTIRPYLNRLDISVPLAHDEKRLHAVEDPGLDWIKEYCAGCRDGTVEDAVAAFEEKIDVRLAQLREELERLGVLEAPLTESVLDRVIFYLETYEIPIERDDRGVLLADPTSAAYVDRPLVFCLGLDDGWTHASPRRPWIDRGDEFARQCRSFEMILQSGLERRYLVVNATGGRAVSPTIYLDEVLEDDFEEFADLSAVRHGRPRREKGDGFERSPVDGITPWDPVETISQSRLNGFVASPRDYLFDQLVDGPEKVYLAEGSLFHDFAEFYLSHPHEIEGPDGEPDPGRLGECADVMVEELTPFHRAAQLPGRRTRYIAGMATIVQFVRTRVRDAADVETELEPAGWADNAFAERFGRELEGSITELWFEDEAVGIRGLIDLLAAEDHLVDFKSGAKDRAAAIIDRSTLDPPAERPNFQALLYLTYARKQRPDRELTFSFVHFLEAADEAVTGTPSVDECITEIGYFPDDYAEHLRTPAVFEGLCEDASGDCNKTFRKIEHADWLAVLDEHPVPKTRRKDELIESDFNDALTRHLRSIVGEYKYVTNGCVQACRYLVGLRRANYFADDLDAFETFVNERLDELNAYRRGEARFPVAGPGGEPDWRYINHRDMLLEGEIPPPNRGPAE